MKKAENGMQALSEDELEGISGGSDVQYVTRCEKCGKVIHYTGLRAPKFCSSCGSKSSHHKFLE